MPADWREPDQASGPGRPRQHLALGDRDSANAIWAKRLIATWALLDSTVAYLMCGDGDGLAASAELFAAAHHRFGLASTVDEMVEANHCDYPANCSFPDDSRDALRRLRSAGWKVAVVTNGPQSQERKLEVARLGDEVDAVCVSALVDSWKPDPGIFAEAARRCGVAG